MKKDESLLGIFSLIIGFFAIFTIQFWIGVALAVVSFGLAVPSVIQQKKTKICGILGLIASLIVIIAWYIKLTGRLPI